MTNIGYECCICHRVFTGWGNNPWPVSEDTDDRCCDACNSTYVIPARLAMMYKEKK